jgi:hypothetical protein
MMDRTPFKACYAAVCLRGCGLALSEGFGAPDCLERRYERGRALPSVQPIRLAARCEPMRLQSVIAIIIIVSIIIAIIIIAIVVVDTLLLLSICCGYVVVDTLFSHR